MKRTINDAVVHGAIAGILAGACVALWFLILDLAAGTPFHTPAALAAVLLDLPSVDVWPRFVVLYSVVHFSVFALLGIAAALILAGLGISPGWLVGMVFGIAVLEAVHYSALLLTGAKVLTVLPPGHVLAANLLGGVVMMTYLHRGFGSDRPLGFLWLKHHPLLTNGLVTGLIGAGAVALVFFLIDIIAGQPLRTPSALGSVVFLGADSPEDVVMNPGIVGAYTIIHILVFAAVGLLMVLVARQLERTPGMWLLVTLAFIVLEGMSLPLLGMLGHSVLGAAALWQITLGNVIALGAMGYWVWRISPELRHKLLDEPVATLL